VSESENKRVDVGVCTFRRTHLAETLRSISRLDLPQGWHIRVIVADNDEIPSARCIAEETARECKLDLLYVHVPAYNISLARNACLDAATAPLLAFIDDDEIATPQWLSELLKVSEMQKADVILGPVRAIYAPESAEWLKGGDFHSTLPVWVCGDIVTGYSCNVLFRRLVPAIKNKRFSLELGRSGGEDTEFFASIHRDGGRIAYAENAFITEEVSALRANMRWLMARRFRSGQVHGFLLLQAHSGLAVRFKNIALATVKSLFCFVCAAIFCCGMVQGRRWLLRGVLHAGVVARLLGKREITLY
jgi:succinoglycan biosynthesis protein ExoM